MMGEALSDAVVLRIERCRLRLSGKSWAFALGNRPQIEAHWQKRRACNPGFFNGKIYVMEPPRISGGLLTANFIETDFASFLYWKDNGYRDTSVRDGFGSALIRSRGGEVLLGRQLPGHVNAGLLYMPGGFIDQRDVRDDGLVDIDGSIAREVGEEIGLGFEHFLRQPGYLVTQIGCQISIAVELISPLPAQSLREMLLERIAQQNDPELSDFAIYAEPPSAEDTDVAAFSRHAVAAVLKGGEEVAIN